MSVGYMFIALVAVSAAWFCYSALERNERLDYEVQHVNWPIYLALKDLNALQYNSLRLTNRWAFQPNPQDKQALVDIHKTEFLALKRTLEKITSESDDASLKTGVDDLLEGVQKALLAQNEVMEILKSDTSYSSASMDKALRIIDKNITPAIKNTENRLEKSILIQKSRIAAAQLTKKENRGLIVLTLVAMVLLFIAASIISYYFTVEKVVRPIVYLKDIILQIGEGNMIEIKFKERKDEIGQIMKAIKALMRGMREKLVFAEEIGNGNYTNTTFTLLSDKDTMGKALLDMRENLKRNAEGERQRNWSVAGLADFAEIIRNQNDFQKLGDTIISNIVKYTGSNQGGLFICQDSNDTHEEHLRLLSCYAWDKKKFEERVIYRGQGVVGQCWEEGGPVYMTQVPEDYVHITSGLGYATPRSIFIVPLKVNETIYGVLELASFDPYKNYKQDFIVKVCENIASAVAAARNNEQTKRLLELSRQQAEEMRSQEEEMRQNMEELTSTQEEMGRILATTQNKERFLREMMDASTDSIITFDKSYSVLSYNRVAFEGFKAVGLRLDIGSNLLTLIARFGDGFKAIYDRALAGESFQVESRADDRVYIVHYVPVRGVEGEIIAVAVFAKDVTDIMQAKQEADRLLIESQAQEEELRQTMEELQATMESEAKRMRELERTSAQLEAQKQMMNKTIDKLKIRENESKAKSEELEMKEQQLNAQQTMMEQTVQEFIQREATLQQQLEEKENLIAALSKV
ncbi:MAG TPA: GAF domain-containing protein [Ohtaekwangia sp.]|uniref:GAF domain-containing protein n=1 Tax=Ohtaekwangia sp. TaxID=2066019 RepID=UPI002F949E37